MDCSRSRWKRCFNPRPREGTTGRSTRRPASRRCFNPRPREGATVKTAKTLDELHVSIRAPVKGRQIAVDGISLTIAEISRTDSWFEVWLIPNTRRATIIDGIGAGYRANIEIERSTQVVVDTVRDPVNKALDERFATLEAALSRAGSTVTRPGASQIRDSGEFASLDAGEALSEQHARARANNTGR